MSRRVISTFVCAYCRGLKVTSEFSKGQCTLASSVRVQNRANLDFRVSFEYIFASDSSIIVLRRKFEAFFRLSVCVLRLTYVKYDRMTNTFEILSSVTTRPANEKIRPTVPEDKFYWSTLDARAQKCRIPAFVQNERYPHSK